MCSVAYASDLIRRELAARDVICDRYLGSTLAYHRALGVGIDWDVRQLHLVQPDYAFLLEVSDESERRRRLRARRRRTAGDRLLENPTVRETIASEYDRFPWIRIDTAQHTVVEVVALITAHLDEKPYPGPNLVSRSLDH